MVESDKATLDIPSPIAGRLVEMLVGLGDTVSAGTLVARIAAADTAAEAKAERSSGTPEAGPPPVAAPSVPSAGAPADAACDVLVIGGGPGGYAAAFRAADLGRRVILVERDATLGGVCLNVGCIPSKALLHVAAVTEEAARLGDARHPLRRPRRSISPSCGRSRPPPCGASPMGSPRWRASARSRSCAAPRSSPDRTRSRWRSMRAGTRSVTFSNAIVAAGSTPTALPMLPEDPRIVNSTGALDLPFVPTRMLVIGGGIIGLEMATVYSALGARIDLVERLPNLMEGVDRDLVAVWTKRNAHRFDRVQTGAEIVSVTAETDGIAVTLAGGAEPQIYDLVLQAAGRRPNGAALGLGAAGVTVESGFIPVDAQMRTNVPHIYAVGDLVGQPMLAHKAVHQGHVAAEVAAGHRAGFDAGVIPSVAYTDPEIAWVGLTETAAKAAGRAVEVARFPWAASGRAIANGADYGLTKLLFDARHEARARRRHRRPERGRHDRRGRAGHRDGGGRHRHRPDDPPAPDAGRDDRPGGRGRARPLHRPAARGAATQDGASRPCGLSWLDLGRRRRVGPRSAGPQRSAGRPREGRSAETEASIGRMRGAMPWRGEPLFRGSTAIGPGLARIRLAIRKSLPIGLVMTAILPVSAARNARAEAPATIDAPAGASAEALTAALRSRILAAHSATFALESWCADHKLAADPRLVAERLAGPDKPLTAAQRAGWASVRTSRCAIGACASPAATASCRRRTTGTSRPG